MIGAARFFDVLRQLNGLVAGTAGMAWWRFLIYNGIGALLWVGVWGLGVYLAGRQLNDALAVIKHLEPWFVTLTVTAAGVLLAYLWLRRNSPGSSR
jgi:membrane protein DedA with SNARE-associated domain